MKSGERSTEWVKRLPEVVSALNREKTRLTGRRPVDAIKEKVINAKSSTFTRLSRLRMKMNQFEKIRPRRINDCSKGNGTPAGVSGKSIKKNDRFLEFFGRIFWNFWIFGFSEIIFWIFFGFSVFSGFFWIFPDFYFSCSNFDLKKLNFSILDFLKFYFFIFIFLFFLFLFLIFLLNSGGN